MVFDEQTGKNLWNLSYSIGIPEIDQEHKKLFSIIGKIMELTEKGEDGKVQHACREGVKFFKNYALGHFAHEEKLMQSLNYGGFESHKKIHDDLRDNIIPAIEKELEENGYSIHVVRHFLGICTAWLSIHIKSEDQAIVNKRNTSRIQMEIGKREESFERILKKVILDMYGLEMEMISKRYTGWHFGKAIFHEMTYTSEGRRPMHIIYAMEEKMILSLASQNLGIEFKQVNEFLVSAVKEVLDEIGKKISFYMGLDGEYKSRSGMMLSTMEIEEIFNDRTILYSTLFKTPIGNFACSIYEH